MKDMEIPDSYPREYKKCPACGSTETVAKRAKREEVNAGKWLPDTPVRMFPVVTSMIDPKLASKILSCTVLLSDFDICWECGLLYCVKVSKIQGIVQHQPMQGQGPGFPPGSFGMG